MQAKENNEVAGSPVACRIDAQDVRRERLFGAAWMIGSLVGMFALPALTGALNLVGLVVLSFLAALISFLWSSSVLAGVERGPGERALAPGTASLSDGEIAVTTSSGRATFPLASVTGGWAETARLEPAAPPSGEAPIRPEEERLEHVAVLTFADGRVLAVTRPSEEAVTTFLSKAGAGASARAVRMRGYREDVLGRKFAGFFAGLFGLLVVFASVVLVVGVIAMLLSGAREAVTPLILGLFMGLPLWSLFWWMLRKVLPSWIEIGVDGVALRGALRRRFVRHADIEEVRSKMSGGLAIRRVVEIRLKDGGVLEFPVGTAAQALAIRDRITAANAGSAQGDTARLADVLARAGRPITEWRRALAQVISDSGYRSAGHDLEAVIRVVEDVAAPLEQRIAGALAALPSGGEEAKKRIRIAAEACVEPRVRVALTQAASGEIADEELEAIAAAEAAARS